MSRRLSSACLRPTVCTGRSRGIVKNLVAALLLQVAQESEIILKMLDHIQNENQLKVSILDVAEIPKAGVQPFIGPVLG